MRRFWKRAFQRKKDEEPVTIQQEEADMVESATANFEKCVGLDESGFFGERENWINLKKLMKNLKEVSEAKGEGENSTALLTETDKAVAMFNDVTTKMVAVLGRHAKQPKLEGFVEDTFVRPALKGCVFVGHVNTDLDSIAGAIGAAELYEGIATRSEADLNGEIMFALKEVAGLEEPPLFDDCPGCSKPDDNGEFKKICLVDHNEVKQMVLSLQKDPNRKKRIVGLIDHHALTESFSSQGPILIDVRPWGSMSSIVAHMYVRNSVSMRPEIARVLMCAILSDTLNLLSVTTTDADRYAVALLAKIGGVEDPDQIARLMFRAKTIWIVNLGPYAMVRGDQKDFSVDGWKYGIAVLEVTDMAPVLENAENLVIELRALKIEKGGKELEHNLQDELDFSFLFVVDVLKQMSVLLVSGGREYALAKEAFPGCPFRRAQPSIKAPGKTISAEQTLCDVGPLVSRKAQFEPAFYTTLSKGFKCHKERVSSPDYKEDEDDPMPTLRRMWCQAGAEQVIIDQDQNYARTTKATKDAASAIFNYSELQLSNME